MLFHKQFFSTFFNWSILFTDSRRDFNSLLCGKIWPHCSSVLAPALVAHQPFNSHNPSFLTFSHKGGFLFTVSTIEHRFDFKVLLLNSQLRVLQGKQAPTGESQAWKRTKSFWIIVGCLAVSSIYRYDYEKQKFSWPEKVKKISWGNTSSIRSFKSLLQSIKSSIEAGKMHCAKNAPR